MLTDDSVHETIRKAIDYLQQATHPHALMFMTILHRRFRIEEFADAGKRYDALLPGHPDRVLRLFRRIFDADNPIDPEDLEHVVSPTDRLIISALYCDRIGLPDTFAEALARAVSQGGYGATHALLAWVWLNDNSYKLDVPDGFVEEMYSAVARIIDEDPTVIHDVNLEAAAFLCLARQHERVDLGFVRRIIALQNPDGGWGAVNESNWHATILALMTLVHVSFPESGASTPISQ